MEEYGREDSGMKNPAVVDLGLANLTLNTFLSETVNEISEVYLFVNIPMLLATIAVNIWVIKVQTWSLSKILHSQIFRLKVLHRKSA